METISGYGVAFFYVKQHVPLRESIILSRFKVVRFLHLNAKIMQIESKQTEKGIVFLHCF